jgi:deoxyribodipyrimidine photo-lyase
MVSDSNVASNVVWMRRDLRLHDHGALYHALQAQGTVQPVFVFDTDILAHFPKRNDRRLSFLAATLCAIDKQLQQRGGGLLVLHGSAKEVMPKLLSALGVTQLFAAEDYEPQAIKRDAFVASHSPAKAHFVKDQVIFAPHEILLANGSPYKVFTPYANSWRSRLTPLSALPYEYNDQGRYAPIDAVKQTVTSHGLKCMDLAAGPKAMLATIGYDYSDDALWPVESGVARLHEFIATKAKSYEFTRDAMAQHGTSRLSPYLRFGLVSVRECVRLALEADAPKWLAELIWREFYAMNLFHTPESAHVEWNPKYRGRLDWSDNDAHLSAWTEGKTGYPVVDAAMRQLLAEGWMHNRARMIVASFLTKHLRISWTKGEAHFAQYLMDYDLASNVGGWQWAASTGTDAQPYFRVFNPTLQSEKFDAKGDYIRRYVPELKNADNDVIHAPWKHPLLVNYYPPIVDHATARDQAMAMFKKLA